MTAPHKVVDDFLPKEHFDKLAKLIVWNNQTINWKLDSQIADPRDDENKSLQYWYATSIGYWNDTPIDTTVWQITRPLVDLIEDFNVLIRIKLNFYPNTQKVLVHKTHIDYPYSHKGALLSLNTCDGYTLLNDGTKIGSVANRMAYFDPSIPHASTTTSNQKGRFNIQINYL